MELKPGYKRTEVGVIPEDWGVEALGDCLEARPSYGINAPAVPFSDRLPVYVRITDISDDGRLLPNQRVSVRAEMSEHYKLAEGDIVFARTGASVGKSYRYNPSDGPLVYAGFLIRVRPDRQKLLPAFAAAYATTGAYWRWVRLMSMRSGQPGINGNEYAQLPIPIPPLSEQRAIAAALSDVDALLEGLTRLIAKKRYLKQAAMQQLLTGQTRLPGFSGEWEDSPLRRFVKQFIVPMRDKPRRFTGDIPWCRIEDFDGIYLSSSKSGQCVDADTVRDMNLKIYPAGTLLVSCSADLGRCAIVTQPLVSNQTFIGLVMDEDVSSNVFFYYLMTSRAEDLNNLSSGTTISYLSREQFEEFVVHVPIDPHEQTAIAAVLSDMDTELSALAARHDKTRALKQAMRQELLTGKTRLVSPEVTHA